MRTLLAVAVLLIFTAGPMALGVEVDSYHVGGFYDQDAPDPPFAIGTPDNDPDEQKYFTGQSFMSGSPGFTLSERRTFFLFDLSSISDTVVSGEFVITLPSFGLVGNFAGGGPEELVITSTAATPAEIVDPAGEGADIQDIFLSFGTGDFYGSIALGPGDIPDPTLPFELSILLSPSALADINAASGLFAISARLVTLDVPPGSSDLYFSGSDLVVGGIPSPVLPKPFLDLVTVPEPSGAAVLALGLIGLVARRDHKD